jgi:hypothetical protein
MTETYSLAATGLRADYKFAAKPVTAPDSAGGGINAAIGQWGGPQTTMKNGAQMLCKNADGSQSWYTYDAERSTPGNLVLKAV